MLPLVDKPTIRYVVEEAVASGLKESTLVTRLLRVDSPEVGRRIRAAGGEG